MSLRPVLLTIGQFYGTLAAARCLGRAGVPVTLAERHALAPARWSRFVARRVRCPEVHETEAFLAWLLDFGRASPGHVLLPTSDDVAWLIAENRDELARHYRMLPTSLAAVDALLDKRALLAHCEAVGLDVPETWFPADETEAAAIAEKVGFPLLIKPRTQVFHQSGSKGALVEDAAALAARYRDLAVNDHYGERVRRRNPAVVRPMLQRYYPGATQDIYGLSGYVGQDGELLAVRAARKILQRPRKLGIGLCFEEAAVDARIAAGVGALFRRVGYRGVFEVELVELGERSVVIDCNPRFYSQMAFDIDRGLPLPLLSYLDAIGDAGGVRALAAAAHAGEAPGEHVYCHRFLFEVMLGAQTMSGRLGPDEAKRWRRWRAEHGGEITDAVADAGDPAPWGVDVVNHLGWIARHPRSFVRSMVLDR